MMLSKLLAVTALLGAGVATLAPDTVLKATDSKRLSKDVAEYWKARTEVEGIDDSFQKLAEDMDKIDAALKKKGAPPLLSLVEDWQQIFWLATQSSLEERKLKKGRLTVEDSEEPAFTYWAPKKFSSKKGPAPLILVVPDAGQSPEDALESGWADEAVRNGAILIAITMPEDASTWAGDAGFTSVMMSFGRAVKTNMFGVDFQRIFLAGHGQGFAAAASTAAYFPHLFAGLIGRGELPAIDTTNFRNVPLYLGGGGESASIAKAVEEVGYANATTGEDTAGGAWDWAQGQKRDGSPAHLTFVPPGATARSAGWVKVEGIDMDGEPRVDAVADRATNTITVTASDVSTVELYFNDALVDLDQPVHVVVNGGEPHEALLARNPKYMVDRVYDFGDWSSVFTAVGSYDVPAGD